MTTYVLPEKPDTSSGERRSIRRVTHGVTSAAGAASCGQPASVRAPATTVANEGAGRRRNTLVILACAVVVFAGGIALGFFLAGNAYEEEIAKADHVLMEARGYRQLKTCVGEVSPMRADLIGALGEARKFHGCVTNVVRMTEEVAF